MNIYEMMDEFAQRVKDYLDNTEGLSIEEEEVGFNILDHLTSYLTYYDGGQL